MRTTPHTDDPLPSGDELDRVIDEAVGWTLASAPATLRSRVLERIEAQEAETIAAARLARRAGTEAGASIVRFVLRPALLPVAGAVLIVAVVAGTWWRVDRQLGAGSPGGRATSALRASVLRDARSAASTRRPDARAAGSPVSVPVGRAQSAQARLGGVAARQGVATRDARIAAASWLVVVGDESEPAAPEHAFPGAPAGDLGQPIALMPRPRPIVIPPITTPPISDAPPVSTLAQPVSTLTAEDVSRDQQDPGKSGGFRR